MAKERDVKKLTARPILEGTDLIVPIEQTKPTLRYPDVYYHHTTGRLQEVERVGERTFLLHNTNNVSFKIELYGPDIWRFRYAVREPFREQPNYAIAQWPDPAAFSIEVEQNEQYLDLITSAIRCRISKEDLSLILIDRAGEHVLFADSAPFVARSTILDGLDSLQVTHRVGKDDVFYGLGDKTCSANLRGHYLQNWNTDAFGYQQDTDPLYRSIPFYYGLHEGIAYGIFVNNTWRTHFDFDSTQTDQVAFWAEGGEMDYIFMHGPQLLDVSRKYMELTGKPELAPLWALGFHQCRWSYYPESRVRELAQEFRERRIPCDAIYLDIDYMDGYRCFTWNHRHFPDPTRLLADLREAGFQTVVMIDPGIRVDPDYWVYRSGMEQEVFCRRSTGELMIGPVWPPNCVFPDYTDPKVRAWWSALYQEMYAEQGVSGFWNDMNEPAVFKVNRATFPDTVLHHREGRGGDHQAAHNIYGLLMSRATYEGLKQSRPNKRPFVLTRATFAGGQRYASVWTGDNIASWEHLRLANLQCQRLSISGFSFVGTDIGGFVDLPSGELLVRWLQLAVFHPFYRIHSMGNNVDGAAEVEADAVQAAALLDRLDQEPWAFGEPYTSQARQAIEWRYRLLPYLYTTFYRHTRSGEPMLRPLAFYDQSDPQALACEPEFIFGDHLLVCPVLRPRAKSMGVYLPQGVWYDYHRGKRYDGQQKIRVRLRPNRLPVFVRAGAVIPHYPVQQYTNELKITQVRLQVYYGSADNNYWYVDAGEGYGYQDGDYRLARFTTQARPQQWEMQQHLVGEYVADCTHYEIQLYGLPFVPRSLRIDGEEQAYQGQQPDEIILRIPANFTRLILSA